MGIMQSKCLWLNHVYFMNDYKEHQWLLDVANKHILHLAEEDDHEIHREVEGSVSASADSVHLLFFVRSRFA